MNQVLMNNHVMNNSPNIQIFISHSKSSAIRSKNERANLFNRSPISNRTQSLKDSKTRNPTNYHHNDESRSAKHAQGAETKETRSSNEGSLKGEGRGNLWWGFIEFR